jgi:arylsulfatase A-like enzyme
LRGSANIPFIVRPPRTWARERGFAYGRTDTVSPAGLQDIMPTILDVCGIPIPPSVEGQSMVGLLLGSSGWREYTCGNCGVAYGLSDGRTKYLWYGDDGIELVFDQQQDPNDCHDLAGDPAWQDRLHVWRGRLAAWLAANGDPHVEDGKLKPLPVPFDEAAARAANTWNNRGRH